jgi:hypothetical protein
MLKGSSCWLCLGSERERLPKNGERSGSGADSCVLVLLLVEDPRNELRSLPSIAELPVQRPDFLCFLLCCEGQRYMFSGEFKE